MLVPRERWMRVLAAWMLVAIAAAFYKPLIGVWSALNGVLALLFLIDAILLYSAKKPQIIRSMGYRFAQGEQGQIQLKISHQSKWIRTIEVYDGIPDTATTESLPWKGEVPCNMNATVKYPIVLSQRGLAHFTDIHLRYSSILGFFSRKCRISAHDEVKVYPNYAPVLRLSLLAMQHRQDQMGLVRKNRQGSSRDFHQLRDFRQGDSLSQVDWKASSRKNMLISRDFQEQMNQHVVFLLDCGRRMRAMDENVPHFDHCLNALLFVAYVALRQGDHVAVQSFGGIDRWLAPVKGLHSVNTVLDHLYDAEATGDPSDFKEAAERIMMRVKRRALVVVMTNLRSEDDKEILPALRILQSKHLVLVTSIQEGVMRDALDHPVENFSAAIKHMAAHQMMEERRQTISRLQAEGIGSIDVTAKNLAVAVANRYLDIKGSGRL